MEIQGPLIQIRKGVFMARGQRVVSSADAAEFYEVSPRALASAVTRNRRRFTPELMFRLTSREQRAVPALKALRKPPLVFTETGVSTLAMVLKSPKAAHISVEIVRETVRKLHSLGLSVWDLLR